MEASTKGDTLPLLPVMMVLCFAAGILVGGIVTQSQPPPKQVAHPEVQLLSLPSGTEEQRPPCIPASLGRLWWNTTKQRIEVCTEANWKEIYARP